MLTTTIALTALTASLRAQDHLSRNRQELREQYTAFVQTLSPGSPKQGESVWEALEKLGEARGEIWMKHKPPPLEGEKPLDLDNLTLEAIMAPQSPFPDEEEIYQPTVTDDKDRAEYAAACRELGLKYLNDCIEAGLFERLDEAVSRRWSVPARYLEGEYLGFEDKPALGAAREFARLNRARMRLALERGDVETFMHAFEQNSRLASVCVRYPGMIPRLIGLRIETLNLDETRHAIDEGKLDGATCAKLAASLRSIDEWPAPSIMFKAEEYSLRDGAEHFYELYGYDPDRFNLVTLGFGLLRWRELSLAHVYFDNIEAMADMNVADRGVIGFDPERFIERRSRWHITLHLVLPVTVDGLRSSDAFVCNLAGVRTILALEDYKARHGVYPDTLEQLVPACVASVPVDTFSGKTPIYQRTGPMSYKLYSVGRDMHDDGGKVVPGAPEDAIDRKRAGYDFRFHWPTDDSR